MIQVYSHTIDTNLKFRKSPMTMTVNVVKGTINSHVGSNMVINASCQTYAL